MGRIPSRHTHLWLKLWNHISWMVQVLAVFNASAVGITWQVGSTQDFKRYKIWRPWVFLALVDQIQWTDLIWWISHELAVFYDPKSYITLRDNDGEWALWELLRKVPLSSDEKSILSMIVIMFSECMFSLYQSVIWLASNRKVPSLVWDCTLLTISYIYVYIYNISYLLIVSSWIKESAILWRRSYPPIESNWATKTMNSIPNILVGSYGFQSRAMTSWFLLSNGKIPTTYTASKDPAPLGM